jgi:hypothetical protein
MNAIAREMKSRENKITLVLSFILKTVKGIL